MMQDGGRDQCGCEGEEMWMSVLVMIWVVNIIGKGGEQFRRVGEAAQEFVLFYVALLDL